MEERRYRGMLPVVGRERRRQAGREVRWQGGRLKRLVAMLEEEG